MIQDLGKCGQGQICMNCQHRWWVLGDLLNKGGVLCRVCIDEIEDVVEEEEDESTQSARLSLNEETSISKPQVLFFLHAIMPPVNKQKK